MFVKCTQSYRLVNKSFCCLLMLLLELIPFLQDLESAILLCLTGEFFFIFQLLSLLTR